MVQRQWPDWWATIRSLALLVVVGVAVASTPSRNPVATALALAAVAAGWLTWNLPGQPDGWVFAGLVVAGAGGLVLCYTNPHGVPFAFPAMVCIRAGTSLPPRRSVALALGLTVAFAVGVLLTGADRTWLLVGPAILALCLGGGLVRRATVRLQREAVAARAEQAALAERARIAREIHDVLAHTLAALTVQLETADALLEGGRAEQARELVVRAGQLAREGMAETRRAIGALRGEALPLPDLLAALSSGYPTATLTVTGEPRDLDADTGLALYRAAQEALTNVRKHAPGAPVELQLTYRPDDVELAVVNGPGTDGVLTGTGGGYGLTGLRERAHLAGGEFSAGPRDGGWRVGVRIPT
jgi:signal transduction histidine kinase